MVHPFVDIVEEAKFALEAVQAERPPSRKMLQKVDIERRSQDGLRQSITIVRPSTFELRRPSSAMHLRHESNYELRPIIQVDDFRPTHLRRQRSDLTNFRSRADPIVEDLQREAYGACPFPCLTQNHSADLVSVSRIPRIR
jgi:hypothetical protein